MAKKQQVVEVLAVEKGKGIKVIGSFETQSLAKFHTENTLKDKYPTAEFITRKVEGVPTFKGEVAESKDTFLKVLASMDETTFGQVAIDIDSDTLLGLILDEEIKNEKGLNKLEKLAIGEDGISRIKTIINSNDSLPYEKLKKDLEKAVIDAITGVTATVEDEEDEDEESTDEVAESPKSNDDVTADEVVEDNSAEIEAQKQAEIEAQKQAELEAQKQAEIEAQKQAEIEAQKQAEIEAQKEAEIEAQKEAELEAQKEAEIEAQKQAELEAQKEAELEAQKEAEAEVDEEVDEDLDLDLDLDDEDLDLDLDDIELTDEELALIAEED